MSQPAEGQVLVAGQSTLGSIFPTPLRCRKTITLLLPFTGFAAVRFDTRKLLMLTQATTGALAFGLRLVTVAGVVHLWHVYVLALLLGCVTAFDAPARQTFVSELVGEAEPAMRGRLRAIRRATALGHTVWSGDRRGDRR